MLFWVISVLVGLGLCIFMLRPLFWALHKPLAAHDSDLTMYKAQLAQLERDVAQGQVDSESAQGLRVELSRRILTLDDPNEGHTSQQILSKRARRLWFVIISGGVIVGAFLLYSQLGHPELSDQPLAARRADMIANRPSQAIAESKATISQSNISPEFTQLLAQLRNAIKNHPDDPKGLQLLADAEASISNFIAAYRAQQQLISVLSDKATADHYAQLGEFLIFAAAGIVTEQSENALIAALQRDPDHAMARYYMGLARTQIGRPDLAYGIWLKLRDDAPAGSRWRELIVQDLPAVAKAAGIRQ